MIEMVMMMDMNVGGATTMRRSCRRRVVNGIKDDAAAVAAKAAASAPRLRIRWCTLCYMYASLSLSLCGRVPQTNERFVVAVLQPSAHNDMLQRRCFP